jgi:hypothetical protein
LRLELPDNDSVRQFKADTYLLWAKIEQDSGFDGESTRLQILANEAARLIGQKNMREDTIRQLDSLFPCKSPT